MAITVAQFEAMVTTANEQLATGDYAAAELSFVQAAGLLAAFPDGGQNSTNIRWDRAALDKQIERCRRLRSSTLGIQRQRIKYTRVCE